MVEIKAIHKSYGNHPVLNGLSLNIEKGKITSFVGANGTGKSTLLSIIARFIKANSGEIFLEGERIDSIKDFDMAKKVAVLKQSNNTHIKLSIRELVSFGRFPHSKGRLTKD
ncbi:MAG: ATP-binding cassette domain-containing protein, partial [Treponema sp.]|nr:ATP-binding cassette domain-containing protein [Treponema sp.]